MSLCEWYFKVQQHFERKYGEKTVVLMQVGKFYEIYQWIPSQSDQVIDFEAHSSLEFKLKTDKSISIEDLDTSEPIGHAIEVSFILNMKLTSKNKGKPHSIHCPLMVGFPPPNYEQHRDLLLLHGYIVVRIDQKDRASDKENVEREVTEIKSPGTNLDSQISYQPTGSNSIVSLFFQLQKPKGSRAGPNATKVLCGLASLDVATGRSSVCEIYSRDEDDIYAIHEIYRFLSIQRPVELIVNLIGEPETVVDYSRYLTEQLEFDRYLTRVVRCNNLDPNFSRDDYQEAMFEKAFSASQASAPIQPGTSRFIYDLDLELYQYGRLSYVILLQYCYEHNEVLIRRLQRPQVGWIDQSKYLILTHNAIDQLDFLPKRTGPLSRRSKLIDSLISVIDLTSTSLGSRFLRRQLLNPITDIERLESLYEMTSELIGDPNLLNGIDQILKRLPDIERLQRKVQMGIVKPKELVTLFHGYQLVQQIYTVLYMSCFEEGKKEALKQLFLTEGEVKDFNECLTETLTLVDLTKLEKVKFTSRVGSKKQSLECDASFINSGCDPEIDQIQTQLCQYQVYLEAICQHLNDLLRGTRTKKIELSIERAKTTQDEEGVQLGQLTVSLHTTPAGAKSIRASQVNVQLCGTLEFHEMRAKSKTMITSELIRQASYGLEVSQSLLEQRLLAKFNEIVAKIGQRSYFKQLSEFIAMIDFLKSNAQMSLKYKYSRPIIDRSAQQHFFEMRGLRHPLIERIIRSEYIPNDISLGEGGPLGLLLLGVNAAGKSSRIKAVPSVISMAQAGLYVPCDLLRFYPASRIITRLSGHDDLLGGKSSFVVEATELRTILRNADANTLVIGDELCRGTETTSGTSLTVQTIATLIKRGAKFMFATHMHHLPKIDLIREAVRSKQLRIAHLTATYNEATGQIIYGRKLEEGPGSSIYGLEVCKSLGIDREFIEGANKIRREIEQIPDLFQSTKRSRYGEGILVDHCLLCGQQVRLQTHHIQEQSKADELGFIGHYHKDSVFNQVTLCESCHPQLHHLKQQIVAQQTLTGTYLVVQGSK